MNSLILALALSGASNAVTQPPFPQPPFPQPLPPGPAYPLPPQSFYPPVPQVTVFPEPMTIEAFVKCFKPCPGKYEVCLIHPRTCKPMKVCFTLPECECPPKVNSGRRYVEFDYGKHEVEIRFKLCGTLEVDYD